MQNIQVFFSGLTLSLLTLLFMLINLFLIIIYFYFVFSFLIFSSERRAIISLSKFYTRKRRERKINIL